MPPQIAHGANPWLVRIPGVDFYDLRRKYTRASSLALRPHCAQGCLLAHHKGNRPIGLNALRVPPIARGEIDTFPGRNMRVNLHSRVRHPHRSMGPSQGAIGRSIPASDQALPSVRPAFSKTRENVPEAGLRLATCQLSAIATAVALSSPLAEAAYLTEARASLVGACDCSVPSAGKRLKWPVSAIKKPPTLLECREDLSKSHNVGGFNLT